MKGFVLGVLMGAIACFAVIRISDTREMVKSEKSSDDAMASVELPLQPTSCSDSSRETQTEPRHSDVTVERITSTAGKELELARADSLHVTSNRAEFIGERSEKEASEICSRAAVLREKKERAKKEAEPKDAAWA